MNIRLCADKNGKVYLEQWISESRLVNGKLTISKGFERVPLVGEGGIESYATPLGQACGMFVVENDEEMYVGPQEGRKLVRRKVFVSAMEISQIAEDEFGYTKLLTKDRFLFKIKQDTTASMFMVLNMLTKFQVHHVSTKGDIAELVLTK